MESNHIQSERETSQAEAVTGAKALRQEELGSKNRKKSTVGKRGVR